MLDLLSPVQTRVANQFPFRPQKCYPCLFLLGLIHTTHLSWTKLSLNRLMSSLAVYDAKSLIVPQISQKKLCSHVENAVCWFFGMSTLSVFSIKRKFNSCYCILCIPLDKCICCFSNCLSGKNELFPPSLFVLCAGILHSCYYEQVQSSQ